jgi:hypothetical protein
LACQLELEGYGIISKRGNLAPEFPAEYDRWGIDRPEPVPHPDDVVIDYKTGEVKINGPVMTEQQDAQEIALHNKKEFEKNLERCTVAMEANPDDLELRRAHKKLKKIVDWLRRGAPFTG